MKMSLANIEGKLSRAEMKKIMAGSGGTCGPQCDNVCMGARGTPCEDVSGTCSTNSAGTCQCLIVC